MAYRGVPEEVRTIRDEVSERGGHLLEPAERVPRDTPTENVLAMVRAAHAEDRQEDGPWG